MGRLFKRHKRFTSAMTALMRKAVSENRDRVYQEIRETQQLYRLLVKWSCGQELTRAQKTEVKAQLIDICKTIPALAVFLVPFGSILLAVLIKVLPFDIVPSAFISAKPTKSNPD
ncbi:MAG: LETM1 domain-containing protein [Calditrichaeota bacterium]|nr:LETM1 domain-containing protein [Calditrichota bacterium]